jgi:hypothetical protein
MTHSQKILVAFATGFVASITVPALLRYLKNDIERQYATEKTPAGVTPSELR